MSSPISPFASSRRRDRRADRPVGLRQVDAAAHRRRARPQLRGHRQASAGTRIGMAFQEPRLLPWRSVEDNMRLAAPQMRPRPSSTLSSAALGLAGHRAHYPGELSLGLARRVALARAFAVKPALLLLDEPFVSLDAPLAWRCSSDLATLVASAGDRRPFS